MKPQQRKDETARAAAKAFLDLWERNLSLIVRDGLPMPLVPTPKDRMDDD
ncbi:MAG: hypothetical protein ACPGID_07740 [Rubricella sp.]